MHLRTDTSMNSHFSKVPTISHSRNGFSIAQRHLTTIQFDYLYPIYWKFIYPGDTLCITETLMARLNTQLYTLYDDLYFDVHAWFTPMRLIQTNWARYQFNAQPAGPSQDNSSLTSPKITMSGLGSGGFVAKSLYDYLGYPTEVNYSADTEHMNNYLARSYNLVWNENYRDQNLQNSATVDLDDGPDNPADYVLLKRGKRHDKFTSALTAAQKGAAQTIPLGSTAPIQGIGKVNRNYPNANVSVYTTGIPGGTAFANSAYVSDSQADYTFAVQGSAATSGNLMIYADLSAAVSATVNQLRQSFAIQHLLEADARGGTRDVESIQHRWGVTVPDFRLQRPEYLGGSTFSFDGHIVPSTVQFDDGGGVVPQGTLTQFSQAMSSFRVNHSFVEHGVFMILISARSNITYQQGLLRELSYRTRYDWYQPEFANLGEVAVYNKEIYAQGTSADSQTFGFQEYGYELRYSENRVTGEFRSNYATSLDVKHMADDYGSLPTLGSAWIQSSTDISRNIAVNTSVADPIELNTMCFGMIARTLPMYSVPGLWRL